MKTVLTTTESKVKVRFPDCDPFNHLNNSRYIDYIINAREDQLIEFYDFDVHALARSEGVSWVVVQNQISYLSPAFLNEVITIETRLLSFTEKSILLEAIVWDENKVSPKAVMWSRQVHYDLKTRQSRSHSQRLMDFFAEAVDPVAENSNFEERVMAFRSKPHQSPRR